MKKHAILRLIKEREEIDDTSKELLMELILILIKCFKDTKKDEIKEFVTNMFKIKIPNSKEE